MTAITDVLLHEASNEAARMQQRDASLKDELLKIEARKAAVQTEREKIRTAAQRALKFMPKIGAEHQCPRCWILNERRAPLRPVGSPSDDFDIMRCACGADFDIPIR